MGKADSPRAVAPLRAKPDGGDIPVANFSPGTYAGRHMLLKTTDQRFTTLLNIILSPLVLRLLWTAIARLVA